MHADRLDQLHAYLASWGLRQFPNEVTLYEWQREHIPSDDLHMLNRLLAERRTTVEAEIAFYDYAARPRVLPALHSQHYDYYLNVGMAIVERIPHARRVLDFGCGVGILTLYYASCFPDVEFLGIDRSPGSIAAASAEARTRGIGNIDFELCADPSRLPEHHFDLILSTHALLQAEADPGLPSRHWNTFERGQDNHLQALLEQRTGLNERLDFLCRLLDPQGRMLLCEKTEHLGRRILFQRAIKARNLKLWAKPVFLRYSSLGTMTTDGPIYEVGLGTCPHNWEWNEQIARQEGQSLYTVSGASAHRMARSLLPRFSHRTLSANAGRFGACQLSLGAWEKALIFCHLTNGKDIEGFVVASQEDEALFTHLIAQWQTRSESDREQFIATLLMSAHVYPAGQAFPWYENHTPIAQIVWEALPDKRVEREATCQESEGREMHVEVGTSNEWAYLYWANTFDQRQVVIMPRDEVSVLHQYFRESLDATQQPAHALTGSERHHRSS